MKSKNYLLVLIKKTLNYLILFLTIYRPKATAGPIPTAYIKVPMPTVPPNDHPHKTTITSIAPLISAIEEPIFFCKPVINPSLGPGPNLAIKYIPLPKPTISTEIITNKN